MSAVPLSQFGVDALVVAQAAQASAAAALMATKTVRFAVTITDIKNPGYVIAPAPGAGTLTKLEISTYPQLDTGDLTIYASQNGISYFPGATLTPADTPGVVASGAPEGAVYSAGVGIEFEIATNNTATGVCVVMVTYLLD